MASLIPRLSKRKPVAEREASGEIEQTYHDIRQVMRVSGVGLVLRVWASFDAFFPQLWRRLRINAESCAFEQAADALRCEAVRLAEPLGRVDLPAGVSLGESQAFQIRAALALYRYVDPKLLLFTSAVKLALEGERVGGASGADRTRLPRGVPERMYAMEMIDDDPDEPLLEDLFEDIAKTFSLPSVADEYRTLGLWPQYLSATWERLKPIVAGESHRRAAERLRDESRRLARELPYLLELRREQIRELGEDDDEFVELTDAFERVLPRLVVDNALLSLAFGDARACAASPFPPRS